MTQSLERLSLTSLRARLPSFSDRNIVEMVALLQRRKHVVRLVLNDWEWLILREALPDLGLLGSAAEFKLRVRVSTSLGDRFTVAVSWSNHPDDAVLVYLAENMAAIERALKLEETPEAPELGHYLGYPECCTAGYGEIVAGRLWVDKVLDIQTYSGLSLYANKLGYLFRGSPSFLPDFYPCSLACPDSARLGQANCRGLYAFGMHELADSMKEKLLRPIVHMPGLLAQLPGAVMQDGRITFDPSLVNFYQSGFDEGLRFFEEGWLPLDQDQIHGIPFKILSFVDDATGDTH